MSDRRPPLVLTGGPAIGKSTAARLLTAARERCAVIEVDDVRQLIIAGHAAPWQGADGRRQHLLGVNNAAALVRNFAAADFESVVTDVITPTTIGTYRAELPEAFLVRLRLPLGEARERAATRTRFLTAAEFDTLHAHEQSDPPAVDATLDVSGLTIDQQVLAIERAWERHGR